ncbi:hypothetical protein BD413DRAFT_518932 [Trametes elegans]|nr:hypothetical protein BD413DRAFT_518932 [Trametes elegans]
MQVAPPRWCYIWEPVPDRSLEWNTVLHQGPPVAAHTFLGAQMVHPSTQTETTEWHPVPFSGVSASGPGYHDDTTTWSTGIHTQPQSTGDTISKEDQRVNDFLPCGPAARRTDNPWTAPPGLASRVAIPPSGSSSDEHSIHQDAGWRSQTGCMGHTGTYAATSAVAPLPSGEDVFAAAFAASDAQFGPMPMHDDMDAILARILNIIN